MKYLLVLFLTALMFNVRAQSVKIRNLPDATYDESAYMVVDKAGYATAKKILISTLLSTIRSERATNDTITRRAVGLNDSGTYAYDEGSNYVTSALMAGYDTASVKTALHILDSVIYNKDNLFSSSVGTQSVIQSNAGDTADGDYSVAINYQTAAKQDGSFAHGNKSVSPYPYSRAMASGSVLSAWGAAQTVEFVCYGESKSTTADTLLINGQYPIGVTTDMIARVHVDVVAVQSNQIVGTRGDSFSQSWDLTIKNLAGTTAFVDTPDSTTAHRDVAGLGLVTMTADNSTDRLQIIVTGNASKDLYWVAYVRATIVGFRNFTLGY